MIEMKEAVRYRSHGQWVIREKLNPYGPNPDFHPDELPETFYIQMVAKDGWYLVSSTEVRRRKNVWLQTYCRQAPVG